MCFRPDGGAGVARVDGINCARLAKDTSLNNFGLVIAYVIPGFAILWGLRPVVPDIDLLLGSPVTDAPTVGGFLYTTLAAIGCGMVVSTVRWMVIDTIHHTTGLRPPKWDFARLRESAAAFDLVVEHYYRYCQFHSNLCLSLLAVFTVRQWLGGFSTAPAAVDFGLLGLAVILFIGSRDSLRRYYTRGGALLGTNHAVPVPRMRKGAPRRAASTTADEV